jgi:hypothetical protein
VNDKGNEGVTGVSVPVSASRVVTLVLVFAGLGVVGAELAVLFSGSHVRWAAYEGGIGAWVASLSGLPFSLKIVGLPKEQDGQFWKLWGLGMAIRTSVGLLAAVVLIFAGPSDGSLKSGLLVLASLHFVSTMIETMWVSARLTQLNCKQTTGT